jgi:predicted nucleic acid-binding protein
MRARQENVYVPLTLGIAERAGVLRTEARRSSDQDISGIDALIAATAEQISDHAAVTILTGDLEDIKLLVGVTRRTNIAVDVPG